MIKALLFDVDGVLVIGEHWHKDLERTHGITSDQLTPFFKGPFQACLVGKADLKVELASVLPRVGWPLSMNGTKNDAKRLSSSPGSFQALKLAQWRRSQ